MIMASIAGRKIHSIVERSGRTYQVTVIIDGRYVASIRKRHDVFWLSHCFPKCPAWARPFLDRVQWGTHKSIDTLRCTVATVLQRAAMVHYGLACRCGEPATGFRVDPDGTKALTEGEWDDRDPFPECLGCRR